jgi:hypothetical protein
MARPKKRQQRPATTPEGRENQLISLAVDLAEKQLSEGTASAQVISHYLKLGSTRERLEQERLSGEIDVLQGKAEQMAQAKRIEELYGVALNAMRSYAGQDVNFSDEVDDEY